MQQTNFTGWIDQQTVTVPPINTYTDVTVPHNIATLVLKEHDLLVFQVEFEVDSAVPAAAASILARLYIGGALMHAFSFPETIPDAPGKYSLVCMFQNIADEVLQTRVKTAAWVDGIAYETIEDNPASSAQSGNLKLQLRVNQTAVQITVFQSIITRVRAGLT